MDFQMGPWLVRPSANSVLRHGRTWHVTAKSMDVLVCLARRGGEVVPKAEIFQEVWKEVFVSDDALTRCIGELRRIFQQAAEEPAVIETVAKRGYRIAAPVSWDRPERAPHPDPAPAEKLAEPIIPRPRQRRWWPLAALALGLLAAAATTLWRRPRWGPPRIRSIAVLPLLNLSGDPAQEYFADGMTEVLTSNLSKLKNLGVISRTSAMTYKGTRKPVRVIARELGVDALVEGSVLRSGTRIRIVAQLIDASADAHLWSRTFEREFEDVLPLQAEVAEAIVREIHSAVTPEDRVRLAYRPRIDPEAYDAYLKGMFHLNKFTPEGFERGISYLQQAVDKNPADPFAYAALALGYSIVGHDRFPDAFVRAKSAAQKSLELGGPLAEAYAALGMEELYSDWDVVRAGPDLERALELKPNFAEARRNYSWYLRLLGRPRQALAEMKQAGELEPLVPLFAADLAWQYFEEGQLDAAMTEAQKSIELNPAFSEGLAVAGWVLAERGRLDEALKVHMQAAAADRSWRWPLGQTLARMGRKDDALRIAAEIATAPGPMDQWGLAVICAALGDRDESLRWLEAARKSRFSWMPWVLDFSRRAADLFTPLRQDRRFEGLIRAIGVPDMGHQTLEK
jgi:TolB-like protein/DNA-binding winged helix-turn-helix (wHTH) protein